MNEDLPLLPVRCLVNLLLQDALVQHRHNHVVEVESHPGVVQYPDDVGQVVQLVLAEEFVVQVEGANTMFTCAM